MNTRVHHEELTPDQIKSRDTKVEKAIETFKKLHPDLAANPGKLSQIRQAIFLNITDSVKAHVTDNSKEARKARKEAVLATAAEHNIRFTHYRIYDETETVLEISPGSKKNSSIITTEIEDIPSNFGGSTWAWNLELDEDNQLVMAVAIAICNISDPFDPLVGMELALERFIAGQILYEPTRPERIGFVKQGNVENDYRFSLENGFEIDVIDDEE